MVVRGKFYCIAKLMETNADMQQVSGTYSFYMGNVTVGFTNADGVVVYVEGEVLKISAEERLLLLNAKNKRLEKEKNNLYDRISLVVFDA